MIAHLIRAAGFVALLLAASPQTSTQPPALQAASAARTWRAEGEVCIRLERFEAQNSLVVSGARGEPSRIALTRVGARLAVNEREISDGEFWIEPADAGVGLTIGDAHYPGRLRVRALARDLGPATGLSVDDIVDLEQYIAGVVASELQLIGALPAELEAQAIASRSFALAQLAARGSRSLEVRLYDSTRDQAFRGMFQPTRDPQSQAAAQALAQAMEKTRGKILTEDGATLDARFHAACGGRTADAADVFPEAAGFRALRSVDCAGCLNNVEPRPEVPPSAVPASAKDLSWRTTLEREQLDRLAQAFELGPHLTALEPVRRDRGGRWLEVELRGSDATRRVSFERVRKTLKGSAIASNLVLATLPRAGAPIEEGLMLTGRGRGHGVGLCQNGSHAYALAGWSSAEILDHYYPGSTLVPGSALADGR